MKATCRSDAAAQIKETLTAREVVEFYGFTPNRGGYIHCPFHAGDNNGSLKVYDGDRGWHCFGCNAGGTVIDFVMKLFDISFRQAVLRIDSDFGLRLTYERPDPKARSALLESGGKSKRKRPDAVQNTGYWRQSTGSALKR